MNQLFGRFAERTQYVQWVHTEKEHYESKNSYKDKEAKQPIGYHPTVSGESEEHRDPDRWASKVSSGDGWPLDGYAHSVQDRSAVGGFDPGNRRAIRPACGRVAPDPRYALAGWFACPCGYAA